MRYRIDACLIATIFWQAWRTLYPVYLLNLAHLLKMKLWGGQYYSPSSTQWCPIKTKLLQPFLNIDVFPFRSTFTVCITISGKLILIKQREFLMWMFIKFVYCLLKTNILFEQVNTLLYLCGSASAWNSTRTAPCSTKLFVQLVCPKYWLFTFPKISFYLNEKDTSISRIAGGSNNDLDSIPAEVSLIPIVPDLNRSSFEACITRNISVHENSCKINC